MCKSLSTPYQWDSLDKSVLQRSAKVIEGIKHQAIKKIVIEYCKKSLQFSSISSLDVLIVKRALLDVDGAAIVARFKKHPIIPDSIIKYFVGKAQLVRVENDILPVALIFPGADETTLEHECIHLCQMLNNQPCLLTLTERLAFCEQNAEVVIKSALSINPEQALDLFIRWILDNVWGELEAYYFTDPQNALTGAQRSSRPYETIVNNILVWGIDKVIPDALDRCMDEFLFFFDELVSQVEWVRDLVTESGSESLSNALWLAKERDEISQTNMMLEKKRRM